MSNSINSNIENDYGQFVILHNDDIEYNTEYNHNLPDVKYSNGKYNVSQTKLHDKSLQSHNISYKYSTNVNIYRDGMLCLFGCVALSTFYTINCICSIYRKA